MQSTKKQMNNVNNWCKAQDNKINHLNGSVYDANVWYDVDVLLEQMRSQQGSVCK